MTANWDRHFRRMDRPASVLEWAVLEWEAQVWEAQVWEAPELEAQVSAPLSVSR